MINNNIEASIYLGFGYIAVRMREKHGHLFVGIPIVTHGWLVFLGLLRLITNKFSTIDALIVTFSIIRLKII